MQRARQPAHGEQASTLDCVGPPLHPRVACPCSRYTDPDEAKAILAAAKEANPDDAEGLHLGCVPLGEAFKVCKVWPAEEGDVENEETKNINLKLQGTRRIGTEVIPALLKQLEEQGIDAGCWQLPVCTSRASLEPRPVDPYSPNRSVTSQPLLRVGAPALGPADPPRLDHSQSAATSCRSPPPATRRVRRKCPSL